MSIDQPIQKIDRVRIPSDLSDQLSQFFTDLKLSILARTIESVKLPDSPNTDYILRTEDILPVARQLLSKSADELEKTFATFELQHVRRAS